MEDGRLEIKWMLLPPAPDAALKLIQCGCKKGCKTRACSCKAHGIRCSDLCNCNDCTNKSENDRRQESDDDADNYSSDELYDDSESDEDSDDDNDEASNDEFENLRME